METSKYSTVEIRSRAVQAVCKGQPQNVVAKAYQVDRITLYRWCQRYEENSPNGLARKEGSGRPRLLCEVDGQQLRHFVLQPASKYGYETDFWTCRRLIQIAKNNIRVAVSQPTMWRTLRDWGLTYQKPEREYMEGSEKLRREWIKRDIPRIKHAVKKYRAILYCEDEASLSLTAILGKTWAPKGQTPMQKVTGKRGSIAAMSALTGTGGLVFTLHEKRITSEEVIHFLDQLLRHHPRRHLVIVMDQARPHTSGKTMRFVAGQPRLHVFNLPKYSPRFNPDEYVWNHLKHQELKSHQAKTTKELKVLANRKLKQMSRDPHLLRGIFFRCCVANLLN